jgi:hypothetical protein
MSGKALGKIIWWSSRDENGIISDSKGNEYYFDRSVIPASKTKSLQKGTLVLFLPTRSDGILAAKKVTLPKSSSLEKYHSQFEFERAQLSLAV